MHSSLLTFGNVIASRPSSLFKVRPLGLRTLILDYKNLSEPMSMNAFWLAHPKIERFELGAQITTDNWSKTFGDEAVPNV